MPLEPLTQRPLTQRVEVGAFYTNGERLGEVDQVNPLGYVTLRDVATGAEIGKGIDAFRRSWWLVRSREEATA